MPRLAVSLLLLLAACAAPQETQGTTLGPPSETAPVAAEAQEGEDEEVCTEERTTGSALTRTVCRPRSQIERERREAEDTLRRGNLTSPLKPRP